MGDKWSWRRFKAYEGILLNFPALDRREVNRLLSAYVGGEEASVDLVPAVCIVLASLVPDHLCERSHAELSRSFVTLLSYGHSMDTAG